MTTGSYDRASSHEFVELNDDVEVIDFHEKPAEPKSTLVSIAGYAFPGETLALLDEYLDNDNIPDEPDWFIEWLPDHTTVHAYTFEDAWFDTSTSESYLDRDICVHPEAEL